MNITRRAILGSTTALGVVALAACTTTPTISQLAQYAQAASNAGLSVLAEVAKPPALLVSAVTALGTAATAVLNAGSAPGASVAQQIYDAAKAFLPAAAPFLSALVPGIGLAIAAVEAFMPVFASAAGLSGAAVATVPVPGVPTLTAAQALKLYGGA